MKKFLKVPGGAVVAVAWVCTTLIMCNLLESDNLQIISASTGLIGITMSMLGMLMSGLMALTGHAVGHAQAYSMVQWDDEESEGDGKNVRKKQIRSGNAPTRTGDK